MPNTFAEDRYSKMNYRRCGRSGLQLPAVSLGFWQSLGKPGNEDICRQCCYYAFDHGVNHFDLANNYGPPPGNSELVVGNILKDMPRDEMIISTKAGYYMWPGPYGDGGSKKYLVASLDQSLARMGLDYVDIFYHHRPDTQTPMEETLAALDLIVKQGKALYVGVSNYSGQQTRQAVAVAQEHDWTPLSIHQPRINMLDRKPIADVLPATDESGIGVIAFSPLAQGRLTDRYLHGLPADSRKGQEDSGEKWYQEQQAAGVWDKVAKLNKIAKSRGQTMAQLALAWLLEDRRITSVLIGVSRLEQLKECIAVGSAAGISDEEMRQIAAILEIGTSD
ncbi:MAG: L-glyceraldehyde 3-phosphate reductase [Planctomycetaceae bacterium]|nr:MAG: L-glyceraldehyde 3-phosphate reductase [Planctomycetaceae bacterium]